MTIPADTASMTLEAVLARLAAHHAVDGILLMGSTGTGNLTPTSDYDLLLILTEIPVPLRTVNTWVDGRLTEVYCTTVRAVDRIIADPAAWADLSDEGIVLTWLQSGRIAHDRTDRLARAQRAARAVPPPGLPGEQEIYEAWRKIGYSVAHIKRYLASDDPVSHIAIDLRLLHGLDEMKAHYFTVRGLPWRQEKPAIRYLSAHDPDWLERFLRCLAEPERRRKVQQYEELARLTLAPVGEPWGAGTAAVGLGPGFGDATVPVPPGTMEDALAFWQGLLTAGAGEIGSRGGGQ